ncbi:MAG: nucleotidyltransferase domain-containing protein [archaeon]
MKNRLKILVFLMENRDRSFTIKDISEKMGINYRIAHEEATALGEMKAIKVEKAAGANFCSFSYNLNALAFEAEEARKEGVLKNRNIRIIYKRLKEIQDPFYILLLFGSFARGAATKTSDIDLCLITDSAMVKERAKSIIGQIPLNIHLLDFTKGEFLSMIRTRDPNVGHEIVRNNVILKGIEEFYELMNYAGQ